MDKAPRRGCRAIEQRETVAVFGDYDVDGITATCLVTSWLRSGPGVRALAYTGPHGGGLRPELAAMDTIKSRGASLIITVDCGITAAGRRNTPPRWSMDMVVTDHHEWGLPCRCRGVVDPKRPDSRYPNADLAGVGVALQAAVRRGGRRRGRAPKQYADLIATGTVADVMPLTGENRYIVRPRAGDAQPPARPGIRALLSESGALGKKSAPPTVGFTLAPRLNACAGGWACRRRRAAAAHQGRGRGHCPPRRRALPPQPRAARR